MTDTKKRVLANLVFSAIAMVALLLWGGTDEEDRRILDELCAFPGLHELAETGDVSLCTHGPDPVRALTAGNIDPEIITPIRRDRLCPGDGKSGHRIHVWWTVPAGAGLKEPTTASAEKQVYDTLGYAERMLQSATTTHYQKFNFYCETDTRPTLIRLGTSVGTNGQIEFEEVTSALQARGVLDDPAVINLVFGLGTNGIYDYCGQGTLMPLSDLDPGDELDTPQTSFVSCMGISDTTVHELMHNFGAVHPDAPNDSGAWHCYDVEDLECYNDGGSYWSNGGTAARRCPDPAPYFTLDCGKDDYYAINPPAGSYLATHWNTSRSPFLTPPRRK